MASAFHTSLLPSLKQLFVAVFFLITLNLYIVVQQLPHPIYQNQQKFDTLLRGFFSLGPYQRRLSCVLPDFTPFNDDFNRIYGSDVHYFLHEQPYSCESPLPQIFKVDVAFEKSTSSVKLVNVEPKQIQFCSLRCVIRESDNEISFDDEQMFVNATVKVDCEFFRISCYKDSVRWPVFSDLYSKSVLSNRDKIVPPGRKGRPYNVLMFGMDGVSRQNFLRLMNKTRTFFENHTDFMNFKIYNKVRDNTFVNIVPMTTGNFIENFNWNESVAMQQPLDFLPFIWKDFSRELSYKTIYAEDFAEISIFNYLKTGFDRPPADYYFRPMNLAMDADKDSWHGDNSLCFKNKFESDYVLSYVKSAMKESLLLNNPFFAFVYLTRITHEDQPMAVIADELYSKYFQQLLLENVYNPEETIVVLFSDHGTRWGPYRSTIYGKYEERLPVFSIALPKSFQRDHPDQFLNIRHNVEKLVTPFDVYHTLNDIKSLSKFSKFDDANNMKRRQFGLSLFSKIPWTRSCQQIGVDQHWCSCHEAVELSTLSFDNIDLARAVVTHLNAEILAKYSSQCSNWTLTSLKDIRLLKPNDKFLIFKTSINDVNDRTVQFDHSTFMEHSRSRLAFFLLTISTRPPQYSGAKHAEAIFEATVQVHIGIDGSFNNIKIEGISRLNAYQNQSNCVGVHAMKPYCFCH